MPDEPTRWIRTPAQLDELVAELAGVRAIGLDTEADSLHHYAEQVCLIQLTAYRGASWLIDPLAVTDLCLLYTSPSPRDRTRSRMPSSA